MAKTLRTPRALQRDPDVDSRFIVVMDYQVPLYQARGYQVAEDLAGPYTLMKPKEKPTGLASLLPGWARSRL